MNSFFCCDLRTYAEEPSYETAKEEKISKINNRTSPNKRTGCFFSFLIAELRRFSQSPKLQNQKLVNAQGRPNKDVQGGLVFPKRNKQTCFLIRHFRVL